MSKDVDKSAQIVGMAIAPFLMVPLALYRAWAFWLLWAWFVASNFESAPELSYGSCLGLMAMLMLFRRAHEAQNISGTEVVMFLASPMLAVMLGAIAKAMGG